jgi:hypothetical protein
MVCMGYANDHAGDVDRMLNPETNVVIETRDVTWAEWHGGKTIPPSLKLFAADVAVNMDNDEIIDDDFAPPFTTFQRSSEPHLIPEYILNNDEVDEAGRKSTTGPPAVGAGRNNESAPPAVSRVHRELAKLDTSYNPTVNKIEEVNDENIQAHFVFHSALTSDPGEPRTLKEALAHKECKKWITAIKKEYDNFVITRGAWEKVSVDTLKKGQRPISTKWVFKIKQEHDGTKRYKARVVLAIGLGTCWPLSLSKCTR